MLLHRRLMSQKPWVNLSCITTLTLLIYDSLPCISIANLLMRLPLLNDLQIGADLHGVCREFSLDSTNKRHRAGRSHDIVKSVFCLRKTSESRRDLDGTEFSDEESDEEGATMPVDLSLQSLGFIGVDLRLAAAEVLPGLRPQKLKSLVLQSCFYSDFLFTHALSSSEERLNRPTNLEHLTMLSSSSKSTRISFDAVNSMMSHIRGLRSLKFSGMKREGSVRYLSSEAISKQAETLRSLYIDSDSVVPSPTLKHYRSACIWSNWLWASMGFAQSMALNTWTPCCRW